MKAQVEKTDTPANVMCKDVIHISGHLVATLHQLINGIIIHMKWLMRVDPRAATNFNHQLSD